MRQQRPLIDKTIVARKPPWRTNLNDLARDRGPPSEHCSFQTWECRRGRAPWPDAVLEARPEEQGGLEVSPPTLANPHKAM